MTNVDLPCPACGGPVVYDGFYWCEACAWEPPAANDPLRLTTPAQQAQMVELLAGLIRARRARGLDTTRDEFFLPADHPLRA